MADYSELKRRAQEIRDEVKAGANTANRVGLALEETVKALEAENKRAEQAEESLENSVQLLQDNTEDLQSIRDEVERLGSDKADKSALEATNKEVSKKQNKLDNYKEDPSNGSVEIFAQDKVSVSNDSQGGVSCVEVYNEEDTEGIIPVARMSADKENGDYASVTVRGNEVHIEGDGVKVNGEDLESFRTTVVNDLTTGGADKALSAEMGKAIVNTINNIKPVVINGNVTNAADEEDITSEDNLLKLKDRTGLNGMGYIILRKGKPFKEQLIQSNTIYEIRYGFDLGGETVEIPENCTLKFDGGKLSNGVIVSSNTSISNDKEVEIFFNILLSGNWSGKASDTWFSYDAESKQHYDIISSLFKFESVNISRPIYFIEKWQTITTNSTRSYVNGHGVKIVFPHNKGVKVDGWGNLKQYQVSALFSASEGEREYFHIKDIAFIDNNDVINGWGEDVNVEQITRLNVFAASYKNIVLDGVSYDGTGELLHIWNTSMDIDSILINNNKVITSEFAYEIGILTDGKCKHIAITNTVIEGRINAPFVGLVSIVGDQGVDYVEMRNNTINAKRGGNIESLSIKKFDVIGNQFVNQWLATDASLLDEVFIAHNTFIQDCDTHYGSFKFTGKKLTILSNNIITRTGFRIEQISTAPSEQLIFVNNTILYQGNAPTGYQNVFAFAQTNKSAILVNNQFINTTVNSENSPFIALPNTMVSCKGLDIHNFSLQDNNGMFSTQWTYIQSTDLQHINGLATGGQTINKELPASSVDRTAVSCEILCIYANSLDVKELITFDFGDNNKVTLTSNYGNLTPYINNSPVSGYTVSMTDYQVSKGYESEILITFTCFELNGKVMVYTKINNNECVLLTSDIPWSEPNVTIYTTDKLPLKAYRVYNGGILPTGNINSVKPKNNITGLTDAYINIISANRPSGSSVKIGKMYFDTTLNKPIWWTGAAWVDSTGATV